MDPDSEAVRAAMGAMKVASHCWLSNNSNRNRYSCLRCHLDLQEEKKKDEKKDGDKK